MTLKLQALNDANTADFVGQLAHIYEHSPWVPTAVAAARPFASVDDLHAAMQAAVAAGGEAAQIALLQAHPMLARRAELTAESQEEQRRHGLQSLAESEAASFDAGNDAYLARFGFPFIIAVRGQRDRAAILGALQARLPNPPAVERQTALAEVGRIARFRLDDLIAEG